MIKTGIYIHIPFCVVKCMYCDFYSITEKEDLIPRFIKAITNEIKNCNINISEWIFDTLFIGGGTPSLIKSSYIETILECLDKKFNLSKLKEITIEINPGEAPKNRLYNYKSIGVNRISIGVQSFQPTLLKFLTRIHSKKQIINTYNDVREVGFENVNCDLIYSIPNQTWEMWEDDLRILIDLNPEHISAYTLTVEKGTDLFTMVEKKTIEMPKNSQESRWFINTRNILSRNGYRPYEVSNFSKMGYQCQHNYHYWDIEPYLGFGPSAHSFDGKFRWNNARSLEKYLRCIETNKTPISKKEKLSLVDLTNEFIGFGMRMTKGIDLNNIPDSLQKKYNENILKIINQYPNYFIKSKDNISFNDNGMLHADFIIPNMII